MSKEERRIPTDAAVVIREDFKVDPEVARRIVESTKELLAEIKALPRDSHDFIARNRARLASGDLGDVRSELEIACTLIEKLLKRCHADKRDEDGDHRDLP